MEGRSDQTFVLGVVLLAAGKSTRMGRPKMLLPWNGSTVVGHLIRQWMGLGVAQLGVVCAAGDALIEAELDRLHFADRHRIFNPAPERGMFSSVQCAASWSHWAPALTHWALVLGDQPHIARSTLSTLLDFAARNSRRVCQPSFAGRPRHPVLLPKRIFSSLASSAADDLRHFLSPFEIALCEVQDPGLDLDIDRPQDYEQALKFPTEPAV